MPEPASLAPRTDPLRNAVVTQNLRQMPTRPVSEVLLGKPGSVSESVGPLVQMLLGAAPGAGDVMAAQDSQRAGQGMAEALRAGDWGRAGSQAVEALAHGLGALPMIPAFGSMVKAYHGSPHRFDKFSLDKIGTGEGAQAYGHGLYFAENPKVAGEYQKMENVAVTKDINEKLRQLSKEMDKYAIPGHYRKFRDPRGEELAAEYDRLMHEKLDQKGALYSVSLDVDPDDLLDWDAPLSQQSEKVRKAWSGFSTFVRDNAFVGPGSKETTGEAMYKSLVREYGGLEAASRALAEAGIPGLRYFDGGSRGKGEGTRNVVMFRDDLVKIEGVE